MKHFFFALCLFSSAICLAQDAVNVDSRVSSATIFRDRAMVTREGKTRLSKGISKIVFSGLTTDLDNESVRIAAEGKGVIKILDVKVESKSTIESPEEKKRRIDQKTDSLKAIFSKLFDELTLLNKKKDMLDIFKTQALKNLNEKLSTGAGQPKEWADLQKYFETNLTEIVNGIRVTGKKQSKIQEQIGILNKEKAQIGGPSTKEYKEVLVSVETTENGAVTFHPSYLVHRANWYPFYDMRVSSAEKKGELHFFGMLQQATGEDWQNVSLSFSTAEPLSLKDLPELSPWYLINRSASTGQFRGGRSDMTGEMADSIIRGGRSDYVDRINDAPRADLSTVFTASDTYDIPSDNNAHKVEVSVSSIPIMYEYTTIPKISPNVYLKGKFINKDDFPWLAGDVNIFIDNSYVNRTDFNDILPSDTLEISLGTDARIQVEKVLINKYHETKGLFNGSSKISYDYELRLTNNRTTEESVSVYDQLPTALEEEITVTPVEPKIDMKSLPTDRKVTWNITLQPGEKKIIPFKFSVEYPSDKTIYGLE